MHLSVLAGLLVTAASTPVWGLKDAILIGRDVGLQEKYDFVIVGGTHV